MTADCGIMETVTGRRKALLAYLAALATAPLVGVFALVGLLASGETLQWELQWAHRMQLIALLVVTAWVVLVAVAVRLALFESARISRWQRLAASRVRGTGR